MKIGFKTMPQHISWDDVLATWVELDQDERYESAWLFDHFYPIYGGDEGPCLEAWVTLSALAQTTSRIRIGTMVNGAPYRHPAVFAAMTSTLDIVSNGRLELGLGAGWNETEAGAYGINLGTISERFDRLEEYIECVSLLLSQPISNFQGRFYTLTEARNEPKGPQQPTPPLVIGGTGPKRTMPIVARWADHWNFASGSVEDFATGHRRLQECCAEIGRNPAEITTSTHIYYNAQEPLDKAVDDAIALADAGLDLAIMYPYTDFAPESVHDVADQMEELLT